MARFDGRAVIVTGAAQGMGAATARLFAAEGAKVALCDVKQAEGQATAAEIGGDAFFAALDVRREDQWQALVAEVEKRFGGVDVLVNNAGITHFSTIADDKLEDIERVLDINVIGTILGVKHVVPAMKRRGRGAIVNISSVDGLRGCNGLGVYTASKWAVRGLTKSLAYELGPHNIRVCTVHPGGINTPMGNPMGLSAEDAAKDYQRVPLQRIGQPEEVARVTLFAASDDASYMTGAELAADGGWSAGYYQPLLPGAPDSLA